MLNIEFQICLLLFGSILGYFIASKLNQSVIIGEIFLGIFIGPSVLGLVTYTDVVQSFAQLGAIILLFVIGLEYKLRDVFTFKYGVIAFFGVIVPWVSGFFLAQFFSYNFTSAFFVGTALTATSVAITANVLKEIGKLQTEAAKAIIGAAVIDDILGLIALSFTVQIDTGTVSFLSIMVGLGKAILFLVLGAFIGRRYITKCIVMADRTSFVRKYPESIFIVVVLIALLYAALADISGLSAIVGAFLAGIVLNGVTTHQEKNYRNGVDFLQIIFAPIFFVSLGVLADFHALSYHMIWFLIALTAVAFLTKFLGCYFGARVTKMKHKDSVIVGVGMAPRGEVAMIVALIGLSLGVIQQDIYISVILMSLLTTIIAPILLRYLKPTD